MMPGDGELPPARFTGPEPVERSIGMVLSDLQATLSVRKSDEALELRDLIAAMEKNSFSVLVLLFSLLLVSPLSAVPGATSLFGLTVAAIVAQQLLGRDRVWLPALLLHRSLPVEKTRAALRWLQRPVGWLERLLRQRQRWVFVAPFAQAPLALVMLAALCAPLMEVIPASGSTVGAAISVFSAGLLARDGLFVLAGASLAAILPVTLWLLLT